MRLAIRWDIFQNYFIIIVRYYVASSPNLETENTFTFLRDNNNDYNNAEVHAAERRQQAAPRSIASEGLAL